MKKFIKILDAIDFTARGRELKCRMLEKPRYVSIEQAGIITDSYKQNEEKSVELKRAMALSNTLCKIEIEIDPMELIVGNRAKGSKTGIVFPESGISWVINEIDTLSTRPQDKFLIKEEDKKEIINSIYPYWKGKSLEDNVYRNLGEDLESLSKVIKINQKDHAQGHICPNVEKWLQFGPAGLKKKVKEKLLSAGDEKKEYYEAMYIVLDAACRFIKRYSVLAKEMASEEKNKELRDNLGNISQICDQLSKNPANTLHEAMQSIWFLFVILQVESNASSFSPGRLDQILYPFYKKDIEIGNVSLEGVQELFDALWIKFNEIVYMRNQHSAQYFAGFPIGFNVIIGGQDTDAEDATNELSYIILKAQEHILLPQPNLSVRIHKKSEDLFYERCVDVLKLGSGMPQFFNDESIIPGLKKIGIENADAMNYAVTGCVELTTPGNNLGWSDAAMVNLVKVLELTLNNGVCMQTGKKLGIDVGNLNDYKTFKDIEDAFRKQIDFFINKLTEACEIVEKTHIDLLPSPFLSTVVDDCIEKGIDITRGGAKYNFSGIQLIQCANLADCFAALKELVFDKKRVAKDYLYKNLKENYPDEVLRLTMLNKAPKYGNDIEWVDLLANKWIEYFALELKKRKNYRGGIYHVGMYTVSAHVPMGKNVGATPDGRRSSEALADGGMSAVYGRDVNGPTALLNSVNRVNSEYGTNGTLLNMKFIPSMFNDNEGNNKFCMLLKALTEMKINHVQFNVINKEELIKAMNEPEKFKNLLVRVAGYTAYFVELAKDLQSEIIARTEYGY